MNPSHAPSRRARVALMLALALAVACARQPKAPPPPFDHTYPAWGRVLAHCAGPDGFRYTDLPSFQAEMDRQAEEFAQVKRAEFNGFSRDERLAYLINAHNYFAVRRVGRAYPIASIEGSRLIGSALSRHDIKLLGSHWSLNSLRAEIMGREYYESRAVFSLNWGMKGCAPLPEVAVTPYNLGAMFDRQIRLFVRGETRFRYDRKENLAHASVLFKRYRKAIDRDFTSLWKFVERYVPPEDALAMQKTQPVFQWLPFDKSLNDALAATAAK